MGIETGQLIAAIWCVGLCLTAAIYVGSLFRRSDYDWWETCLYGPVYMMGRLLWRVHFTNQPPPELQTGGLLVANHRSSVDPFFVQLAARRRVHWMVAQEYCRHPIFGPFLALFEVIPTNRSGVDTASTKLAIRITGQGRLVGMFPEGQLNHTPLPLLPVRSGAAMVATRSDVPIIPLYIHGSPYRRTVWSPVFMSAHVGITFGEPIFPEPEPADQSVPSLAQDAAGAQSLGEQDSEAAGVPTTPSAPNDSNDPSGMAPSDQMILKWARQIVALAGHPNYPVSLAARRTRRRRRT